MRLVCWLFGHAKPKRTVRRGHLLNVDWTFGAETDVEELACSRCGRWLDTRAAAPHEDSDPASGDTEPGE